MRRVLSEMDLREFRERVCAAATELLAEQGHDGFNMRELAARLGVSAMTTYRYFDGKDEIFAALQARALNMLADRLESLPDMAGAPLERFVAFCRAYLDFACEEPVRYRLMFHAPQPRLGRPGEVVAAEHRVLQALVDHAGMFAPRSQADRSIERFAQNLWASLHGLAALTVVEMIHEADLDALLLDMAQRFAGHDGLSGFEFGIWAAAANGQAGDAGRAGSGSSSGWIPAGE